MTMARVQLSHSDLAMTCYQRISTCLDGLIGAEDEVEEQGQGSCCTKGALIWGIVSGHAANSSSSFFSCACALPVALLQCQGVKTHQHLPYCR